MSACEGVGFYPSLHGVKPRGFDVPWGPGWHCYCAYVLSGGRPATWRGDRAARGQTQQTSVGGALHRLRADATRGGGSCDVMADAGEAGRVPSIGARVSTSSIYDGMMMAGGDL